jgi:hypothetical protein
MAKLPSMLSIALLALPADEKSCSASASSKQSAHDVIELYDLIFSNSACPHMPLVLDNAPIELVRFCGI